jgi:hypothetical protein
MRYQDRVGERRAGAEERDGAGLMQAWKNGVRACHPKDGKVASAPRRNVLDHCWKITQDRPPVRLAYLHGEEKAMLFSYRSLYRLGRAQPAKAVRRIECLVFHGFV